MRLLYVANARIPTEKAHGVNIAKMCETLGQYHPDTMLVVPDRKNEISEDLFSYYNLRKTFSVKRIPVRDNVDKGFWGYWQTQISFTRNLSRQGWDKSEVVILTRDEWSGFLLSLLGYRVYYDMHGFPENWLFFWKRALRSMKGLICTNEWKMTQAHKRFGISKKKMILARNACDPDQFSVDFSKHEAREQTNLPLDKKIVMYTGHLYDWKGADVLAQAAEHLDINTVVVFVGGTDKDVKVFTKRYKSCNTILVLGHKPHAMMPTYLCAADVLVIPNSKKSANPRLVPYSIYDTSPMKLFEYMASNRPIVASDLPSIREVINEKSAKLVEPDDPEALAASITHMLDHPDQANILVSTAMDLVREYSWDKRAQKILDFMKL